MAHLSDAQQAMAEGDPATALAHALAAWQTTRHPAIAAAIRRLDATAVAAFDAPKARSKTEFHDAWCKLAHADISAVATGWLCARLNDRVPLAQDRLGLLRHTWMAEKHIPLFNRVSLLTPRCPDPRIADAALAVLREGQYGFYDEADAEQVYRPFVDLAVAAGDPATPDALRALARDPRSPRATVREWQRRELQAAADAIPAWPLPELPDGERDGWAALCPAGPEQEPLRDLDALYHAVLADPTDDALREVLADAWLEADDPRGAMYAAAHRSPDEDRAAADKTVQKLVKRHLTDWVGEALATVLNQVTFRRGFLDAASLRANHVASAQLWQAAAADERLATLRTLLQGNGNREHYLRFLLSPEAKDLRRIEIVLAAHVGELNAGPARPFEALVFPKPPSAKLLRSVADARVFDGVTTLALPYPDDLDATVRALAPFASRVRALEFAVPEGRYDLVQTLIPDLDPLASHLRHLALVSGSVPVGWQWQAVARPDGWHLTAIAPPIPQHIPAHLLAGIVPALGVSRDRFGSIAVLGPTPAEVRAALDERWGAPIEFDT